eukprot:COSAG01_NODE_11933_length_1832_cov_10.526152_3_plen_78_part_00
MYSLSWSASDDEDEPRREVVDESGREVVERKVVDEPGRDVVDEPGREGVEREVVDEPRREVVDELRAASWRSRRCLS